MFTRHKKNQIIFLRKIIPNQCKGCQVHLTENILQDIFTLFFLLNRPNNNFFSLHQKTSIGILTTRHRSYFQEIYRGLCKSNWYFIPTSIWWWTDRFLAQKSNKQLWRIKGIVLLYFRLMLYLTWKQSFGFHSKSCLVSIWNATLDLNGSKEIVDWSVDYCRF